MKWTNYWKTQNTKTQGRDNSNMPKLTKEIEFLTLKSFQQRKLGPDCFQGKFYQTFYEVIITDNAQALPENR